METTGIHGEEDTTWNSNTKMDALEYQKTNNVEASNRDELCTYFLQIR